MYIYGTYIPPLERASLSSFLNQALNTITQVLLAFYCSPSHNIPNLSISAILPSTIPLLPPPYCNPSCCPPASLLLQLVRCLLQMVCIDFKLALDPQFPVGIGRVNPICKW